MTRAHDVAFVLFLIPVCAGGLASCSLKRPNVMPVRMLEPEFIEPLSPPAASAEPSSPAAMSIRLLDTEAREHIGHRLLHLQSGGELTEDPVWRWSSTPDRYLDSALRLGLATNPDIRLVDTAGAPSIAVMLLVWQLDSTVRTQLVGVVELSVTGADHSVRTQIIRKSEPVSAELPGNLAAAAGRLLQDLTSEILMRAMQSTASQ